MRLSISSSSFARIVERAQALGDLVEARRHAAGLLRHLLERLAERGQLGAARRQRRQHCADGAPLFARGGNEHLQLIGLFLYQLAFAAAGHAFEGVQHVCRSQSRKIERGPK